jgi:exosome complex protein LRP1
LNGVKATEHPVFRELTRVKQYFEKIKTFENGPDQRKLHLDKAAAARFIKQGLAGASDPNMDTASKS